MKTIVLFGAGKSATVLIDFLKKVGSEKSWRIWIADANEQLLKEKVNNAHNVYYKVLAIEDATNRKLLIAKADLVISLLPPSLHLLVANDCLELSKHLFNASYVSEEINLLNQKVAEKGLLFLCEMGLDPGIDHMSAMQMIDEIKAKGGIIHSFQSHCGGLVAPESDNNQWHYKISWNPKNIILAGKSGAVFMQNNQLVKIDYQQLFEKTANVKIPELNQQFAAYANRDSLSYMPIYGLENCATFKRTTLRHPDFCKKWQQVVELDLTNEIYLPTNSNELVTCKDYWIDYVKNSNKADKILILNELGLLEDALLPNKNMYPATVLQWQLEKHMALATNDLDMIVMQHEVAFSLNNKNYIQTSSLVVKGNNQLHTAMAKTVGLPLGIAAVLFLEGKFQASGVRIPIKQAIYEPVLKALADEGIIFKENLQTI